MTISLPPEVEDAIAEQVRTGRFESAEALVAFGVSIVGGLSTEQLDKLQALRARLSKAQADVDAGRVPPMRVENAIERAKVIRASQQNQ